ncbi:MAG TPA: polyprenyl synthetase family protein, partial [Planctomycetia bacterium]|nr:polyprenyl synthetase family protein [Planctomycetia bacterium]
MSLATVAHESAEAAPTRPKRRSTSHLKLVPPELEVRELVKREAMLFAQGLEKSRPFTKDQLEGFSRTLLDRLGLPEGYLGFAMVMIGNYYWKEQFLSVPYERRMLLLPHCLKNAEGCPAEYDEFGLNCEKCGACSIADYKVRAEQLGYKVLVAEGSPVVLKLIVSGYIDGILGVACLNVLEKAIDKVLLAGVPSFAVPLHSGDCKNTKMDEAWIWEVLEQYKPESTVQTSSYVPLLRAANDLFDKDVDALAPRIRKQSGKSVDTAAAASIADAESIAYDFLIHGGKRFRPFLTLATYAALAKSGENGHVAGEIPTLPDHVRRAAIAIEAFHKASLVHDDIEDDDEYRYGQATLHVRYDVGTAVNVGDYLVGLGYRLVARDRGTTGGDVAADILDRLADAHVKLSEGQGAELAWRRSADKTLKPIDAMGIYALKTSPAFEAALYAGCRLAGAVDGIADKLAVFARHLGVGFQILNDLKDWHGDENNKLLAGQDAIALRPTLLLALALDAAKGATREE